MDNKECCAQCQHSSPVPTEQEEMLHCELPRRYILACLMGWDDRFVAKEDTNDGQ